MDRLRELFAGIPEAKARGFGKGRFSFNVAEGRCGACDGQGAIKIEMHFLSDVWIRCDACNGQRFNASTLDVKWRGMSIADVLNLEVRRALAQFQHHRVMKRILQSLDDVGLGYVRLGQAATTLSGGEAQRLKLAAELARPGGEGTVYVLDEPTTGLHPADVERLIEVLGRLADKGAAVVIVEHNLDIIKVADHVIDLGPEGGDAGGQLLVAGTPEAIAKHPASRTGEHLLPLL
jgi:excinuclease ABC subunit A